MIKVFGYLKCKPGLSPQEFADYYEHNHGPLVLSKAFTPTVYMRNYIQRGDTFNIEGDEISFDCMTELVFADRDDLSAWMASIGVDEIARDEETSLIEPQREPTWWTSVPPRAEPCASRQFGLNTPVTGCAHSGSDAGLLLSMCGGIERRRQPGRQARTRRIGSAWSLADEAAYIENVAK